MKLYIPALGDMLKLTADWTFPLYGESRNWGLYEHLKLEKRTTNNYYDASKSREATIPAGEVLKVDRIYIRNGQSDFDSVTFRLQGHKTKPKVADRVSRYDGEVLGQYVSPVRTIRFWAKLQDVNGLEFESVV